MAFQNLPFLFLFLPLFFCIYQLLPSFRKEVVLLGSLLFYAWGEPTGILVLVCLTLVTYWFVKWMDAEEGKTRTTTMWFLVFVNVFSLFYYKYYGTVLDGFASWIGLPPYTKPTMMPLGISFYVFSLLSYVFDVYRKKINHEHHFLTFALYVSFFPKVIMGPIMRYQEFKEQLHFTRITMHRMDVGMQQFVVGLFEKVVLANQLGVVWQQVQGTSSMASAWLGIIAYTLQLYFDFQGYTQMAMGISSILGIRMPENFHYSYVARSITDFWRRWHKTLSFWFKDYVYIPLGGNRKGPWIQIRNLLIVWLLTGIWHGANVTFIIWGLYYGVLLIIEKYWFSNIQKRLPKVLNWLLTLLIVMIGWVFFASPDLSSALHYLSVMFTGSLGFDVIGKEMLVNTWWILLFALLASIRIIAFIWLQVKETFTSYLPMIQFVGTIAIWLMVFMYSMSDSMQAFLYFKF